MKLYMIQVHTENGKSRDGIYLFEEWKNCLATYNNMIAEYRKNCSILTETDPICDEESNDCETHGGFSAKGRFETITNVYVNDYHVLDNDQE